MAHYKRRKARIHCPRAIRGGETSFRAKWNMQPIRLPERDQLPSYLSAEWDWMWHPRGRHGNKGRKISGPYSPMSSYPKWHDIVFHTRPKRRAGRALEKKVLQGCDPDDMAWPLGNRKPHKYYW